MTWPVSLLSLCKARYDKTWHRSLSFRLSGLAVEDGGDRRAAVAYTWFDMKECNRWALTRLRLSPARLVASCRCSKLQRQLTVHLTSWASLTSHPWPLTCLTCAHMLLDWWVRFPAVTASCFSTGSQYGFRNELQRLASQRVIHHDWHLVSIIRSQGPVNGCIVMHLKVSECFEVPQTGKTCLAVWR